MKAGVARRKVPEKKILLWDRPLCAPLTAHPEINRLGAGRYGAGRKQA